MMIKDYLLWLNDKCAYSERYWHITTTLLTIAVITLSVAAWLHITGTVIRTVHYNQFYADYWCVQMHPVIGYAYQFCYSVAS